MNNKNITKYLKLPFHFEEEALIKDLKAISTKHWTPQIYKMNYKGDWTSIALISEEGDNNNFAYASASEHLKDTAALKKCPYFKKVIRSFKCPLISARLLKLNGHSEIKPHRDYKLGYEDNNFRVHIPIVTNNQVEFILGGKKLEMLPGECWYTNVNFIHSVANRSDSARVHLVIDGERNDWSDEIFFSLAPKESFNLTDSQYSEETKKRIIEELKNKIDPTSQELIKKLENELLPPS
ncbi:MAG: aspartyl/asparaginyl beta-hydroxylase domain-containing protein [Lewinella sp.]